MRINLGVIFVLCVIELSCSAPSHAHNISRALPTENTLRQAARGRRARECNLNVCFAYDGTNFLSVEEFEAEKELIFDVTSILIDFPVSYAAVKYGRRIDHALSLTSNTIPFLLSLNATTQSRARFSNIRQGIRFCSRQLRRHREDVNAIILLTEGLSSGRGNPVGTADQFRRRGGKLFVFGVGSLDEKALLDIAGGDQSNVLDSGDFLDTLSVTERLSEEYVKNCGPMTVTNIEWPLEGES